MVRQIWLYQFLKRETRFYSCKKYSEIEFYEFPEDHAVSQENMNLFLKWLKKPIYKIIQNIYLENHTLKKYSSVKKLTLHCENPLNDLCELNKIFLEKF